MQVPSKSVTSLLMTGFLASCSWIGLVALPQRAAGRVDLNHDLRRIVAPTAPPDNAERIDSGHQQRAEP
jgi:hypothetical protein